MKYSDYMKGAQALRSVTTGNARRSGQFGRFDIGERGLYAIWNVLTRNVVAVVNPNKHVVRYRRGSIYAGKMSNLKGYKSVASDTLTRYRGQRGSIDEQVYTAYVVGDVCRQINNLREDTTIRINLGTREDQRDNILTHIASNVMRGEDRHALMAHRIPELPRRISVTFTREEEMPQARVAIDPSIAARFHESNRVFWHAATESQYVSQFWGEQPAVGSEFDPMASVPEDEYDEITRDVEALSMTETTSVYEPVAFEPRAYQRQLRDAMVAETLAAERSLREPSGEERVRLTDEELNNLPF